MAKWVLLDFDDDADADELISLAKTGLYHIDAPVLNKLNVVAEFKRPTQFCQHTPAERARSNGVRGAKYGWYVCGLCKKPIKGGNQVIYNLLENDGRKSWERELNLQVLVRHRR